MVNIELERIDIQEGITVEALLDSGATGLVMSSEFAKKQVSRLLTVDFILFSLFTLFYFIFLFNFLFLEQLGLGFISHTVTSVTN